MLPMVRWLAVPALAHCELCAYQHRPRTDRGMQEPRAARYALLRREQRSRRRRADRSEEMEGPLDAGLRLHAGRRSRRLPERLQAVHRLSDAMHRQARGLLSGAVERRRDRSDALGPAARRRLLDRPDRLRRQSRGRRAVRRQGHREGAARLPSDLDRAQGQPVPEALRSQGQARRAHLAIVEFGQSRAAACSIRRRGSSRTRTTSR